MVKKIDKEMLQSVEHIGVSLWRAHRKWHVRFATEMAHDGFPWHKEARGAVLAHLGPKGRNQRDLTAALGLSKQAVQQFLDQLQKEGVLRRVVDPNDKRAKFIILTDLGLKDFAHRTLVKRKIESEFRHQLGDKYFEQLRRALDQLTK